jgi:putative hemolysin
MSNFTDFLQPSPSAMQRIATLLDHDGAAYRLRLATSADDVRSAQRLRYQVFNLELQEGLAQSHASGLDADPFDAVCDHLLVEHQSSGAVVGTYRMQTGPQAAAALGYYCAREFEFGVYESLRAEVLELGRACIASDHRNFSVLSLLWRGIASYAQERGARYLLGCSSLTSQSPPEAAQAFAVMQSSLAPVELRTVPCAEFRMHDEVARAGGSFHLPKLLSAYLALGAWVCGPPAIDREFRTIDFLTLLDLKSPAMALRRRRFGIG